jgi:hypothetical protein
MEFCQPWQVVKKCTMQAPTLASASSLFLTDTVGIHAAVGRPVAPSGAPTERRSAPSEETCQAARIVGVESRTMRYGINRTMHRAKLRLEFDPKSKPCEYLNEPVSPKTMTATLIHSVILCGGSGMRL